MPRAIPSALPEQGRIRIGDMEPNRDGKGYHQHKLSNFRLTSADEAVLEEAAALYGGAVQRWDGPNAPRNERNEPTQWELYTASNALQVVVPSLLAVDISFERWVRGKRGCILRCTGEFITRAVDTSLLGQECICPRDDRERARIAATPVKGQDPHACARILRLKVLLPELSGLGVWRLETRGHYATAELNGTLALLQSMGAPLMFRAVLRLEERRQKGEDKDGKPTTFQFVVPVLVPTVTMRELLAPRPQRPLLAAANEAAADLYGDHVSTMAPSLPPPLEARERVDVADLIEAIEAVLVEGGTDPSRYWGALCAHWAIESPRHMAPSQLQELLARVQADLARKQQRAEAHAATGAASPEAQDDEIPF